MEGIFAVIIFGPGALLLATLLIDSYLTQTGRNEDWLVWYWDEEFGWYYHAFRGRNDANSALKSNLGALFMEQVTGALKGKRVYRDRRTKAWVEVRESVNKYYS
jgi:hypothetical protein